VLKPNQQHHQTGSLCQRQQIRKMQAISIPKQIPSKWEQFVTLEADNKVFSGLKVF